MICTGESATKQSSQHETDINVIMGKYLQTGDVSIFNQRVGDYGDVSEIGDYAECQAVLKNAQESFATLPAKIRDAFANDPGELVLSLIHI